MRATIIRLAGCSALRYKTSKNFTGRHPQISRQHSPINHQWTAIFQGYATTIVTYQLTICFLFHLFSSIFILILYMTVTVLHDPPNPRQKEIEAE